MQVLYIGDICRRPLTGGELKHKIAIDRMMGFLDNQIGEESNVKEK